jgi:hypothetical protein
MVRFANLLHHSYNMLKQSNGLDHQIILLNAFFPIKFLKCFLSVVYLNLFQNNVVVPSANTFLSSVSHLNNSIFLHFNLVYFLKFCF